MNGLDGARWRTASPERGRMWTYMTRPEKLLPNSSLAAFLMLAMILSACGASPLDPDDSIPLMSGTVRDAITNAPLSNATVEAQGHSTVSAADGTYSFPRLSYSRALTVTARKDGYRDYSETLQATRETSAYGIFRDIRLIPR